MLQNKKRIIYFTKHTTAGPSSRYRSYAYHSFLEENGFAVTVCPLFPNTYLPEFYKSGKKPYLLTLRGYLRRFFQVLFLKDYHIIYIEYELFPYLPLPLEKWLLRNKKNVVIDYDDAVFHNYDQNQNIWIRKWCGDKIYKLVSMANIVITGSPYLTKVLSVYAQTVVEIPTCVSLQRYISTPPQFISKKEKQAFRIGWIGSPTTSKFIILIKDALLQLQQLYNIKLVLIGFDKKSEPCLEGVDYDIHNWKQDTEIGLLKTCHVGIMPLANEPFAHGKCGFKLIQYMACGLPTLSTPMQANIKINRGGNNLFATSVYEWFSCLSVMIQNRDLYKETGIKNIKVVEEFYSTEKNRYQYLSLFQNLVSESYEA